MAVAKRQNASAEDMTHRDSVMSRIGLESEDRVRFVSSLSNVREQLDTIEESRKALNTGSPASRSSLITLRAEMDQLLDNVREALLASLSVGGAKRLDSFVKEHIKRRIVIYGTEPGSPAR